MKFRWNQWNLEHIARHGVKPEGAEAVMFSARPPYPLHRQDGKWLVWGRAAEGPAHPARGRLPRVVFVVDDDDSVFIIHARPLTDREKRRYRRRTR